ncbi:ABC transporter permease [Pararobbsia silviterrae]|uniref:ABC transporter permease n=1 Tax=Pararobbsia silviterrae TaxID=1792498 RepID=A0A494YCJ3_9BURK|nr:ABC transporter permease [Pararobbsia silviterrae]RKP57714.1 ABC transporter permease [Pararobbsia silviterrae]
MNTIVHQARTPWWRGAWVRKNAIVLIFALFVVFGTAMSAGRLIEPTNISNILFQSAVIGVLALGEALVMLAGGIDLSIVALMVVTAIFMGGAGSEAQQQMSMSNALPYLGFLPAIAVAILGAAAAGFINGLMVVVLRIPAFIATLVMALVLAGLSMLFTGGAPIYNPDPFFANLGAVRMLTLPAPVYILVCVTIFVGFVLARSRFGVMLYALGGNRRAARLSGIPVERATIGVYTIAGLLAGLGGFLFLARTGSVSPTSGDNFLLGTIAAVVVGGVSLAGGKGTIRNAFFGVLFLATLSNLLNILLISPHIQDAISGVVIIVAIAINVRLDPDA